MKKKLISTVPDTFKRPDGNNTPDLHREKPTILDLKETFIDATLTAADPRKPRVRILRD